MIVVNNDNKDVVSAKRLVKPERQTDKFSGSAVGNHTKASLPSKHTLYRALAPRTMAFTLVTYRHTNRVTP